MITEVDAWIESISSMHISGADLETLFNAVPEAIRDEVKAEWDRLAKAWQETKDRPYEEVLAEVLPWLRAYREAHLRRDDITRIVEDNADVWRKLAEV